MAAPRSGMAWRQVAARRWPGAALRPLGGRGSALRAGSGAGAGAREGWAAGTRVLHPSQGGKVDDPYAAVAPPLYQTATFDQPTATTFGEFDYTRSGNPTRRMLEEQMASLDGASRGFAFVSGMAAITAVARLVGSGEGIVTGNDIYGGTSRLLAQVLDRAAVEVQNVDMTDLSAVEAACSSGNVKLVIVESPTNPRMEISDVRRICEVAHRAGALVCVDNSIMALFQNPLDLGADINMVSATKFIGGHSDVTAGILTVRDAELGDRIYFHQNSEGTGLGPFDCWLCLRGLKTMALRMERQAENAQAIAEHLSKHTLVTKVNYPGLPDHPGHALHFEQARSGGSIISFETGDLAVSKRVVEQTALHKVTVSFGSVGSSISLPCYMSHASIPAEVRAARGLPDDLVRISVGIEDVKDLIADLDAALQE